MQPTRQFSCDSPRSNYSIQTTRGSISLLPRGSPINMAVDPSPYGVACLTIDIGVNRSCLRTNSPYLLALQCFQRFGSSGTSTEYGRSECLVHAFSAKVLEGMDPRTKDSSIRCLHAFFGNLRNEPITSESG